MVDQAIAHYLYPQFKFLSGLIGSLSCTSVRKYLRKFTMQVCTQYLRRYVPKVDMYITTYVVMYLRRQYVAMYIASHRNELNAPFYVALFRTIYMFFWKYRVMITTYSMQMFIFVPRRYHVPMYFRSTHVMHCTHVCMHESCMHDSYEGPQLDYHRLLIKRG